jgi:hypothetical protein
LLSSPAEAVPGCGFQKMTEAQGWMIIALAVVAILSIYVTSRK